MNETLRSCDALKVPPLKAGSTWPSRDLVTSALAVHWSGGIGWCSSSGPGGGGFFSVPAGIVTRPESAALLPLSASTHAPYTIHDTSLVGSNGAQSSSRVSLVREYWLLAGAASAKSPETTTVEPGALTSSGPRSNATRSSVSADG